jgi:hypothetical protein
MDNDRNDMRYWFPRLKASGVPVPRTTFVAPPAGLIGILDGEKPDGYDVFIHELGAAARSFGFPVFLRTGHTSHKHGWRSTCFLERCDDIPAHVFNLVEFSECADILGLPYRTWAVREFVPLVSHFTAFDGTPVAVERRVFIRDGKRVCDHPYWPPDAIEGHSPSRPDWRHLLADHEEIARLHDSRTQMHAALDRVGSAFPEGYWSVDFAFGRDGTWYAIDMAEGERSFHWPGCLKGRSQARTEADALARGHARLEAMKAEAERSRALREDLAFATDDVMEGDAD